MDPEIEINVLSCPSLAMLSRVRLDTTSFPELDYLARRIEHLDEKQMHLFRTAAAKFLRVGENGLVSIKDIINATYNFNNENREWTEIYDGKTIPHPKAGRWYAFGIKIAKAPAKGERVNEQQAEWLTFPANRLIVEDITKRQKVKSLEECVVLDFVGVAPQLKHCVYNSKNVAELNTLAMRIGLFTLDDMRGFKAALEAEKPKTVREALDITENLCLYELDDSIGDEGDFFKSYLDKYLDSRMDRAWLDTLLVQTEGKELLQRLGATVTDYGAISARGRDLYELVPYEDTESIACGDVDGQTGGMTL